MSRRKEMNKTTTCLLAQLILCLGAVIFCVVPSDASAADAIEDRIHYLLVQTVQPDSPGCAIMVIDDGRIVFQRGYGIANLDTGLPITTVTAFNIESVSKQFTAACIALLVEKGELSLDDDIRKYVPEMPAYEGPIQIRHLLHHTSGIRDFEILRFLKGTSLDDTCTERELLDLIGWQKQLNFRPGDMERYTNSGYFLLGVIVKRVTGMSLGQYAEKHIFTPLGMTRTSYHYDPARSAGNLAVPHVSDREGKYHTKPVAVDGNDFGYGGMHTTIEDLYRWDQNFFRNKIGGENLNTLMLTCGTTNSGKTLSYAFGLRISAYRGLRTVSHGGGSLGYNAFLLRFPERRFSVICLANHPFNTASLCYKIADLCLNIPQEKTEPVAAPPAMAAVDPAVYACYEGVYRMDDGTTFIVSTSDNRLFMQQPGARPVELHPKAKTEYFLKGINLEVSFPPDEDGTHSQLVCRQNGHQGSARRLDRRPLRSEQLAEYEGQYYSDELDVTFGVYANQGRLCLKAPRVPDIFQFNFSDPDGKNVLKHLVDDQFMRSYGTIDFSRDPNGKIAGFRINAGGNLKDLRFSRRQEER
jgi:CubicO group peptidase (beta-lactamase class C family)